MTAQDQSSPRPIPPRGRDRHLRHGRRHRPPAPVLAGAAPDPPAGGPGAGAARRRRDLVERGGARSTSTVSRAPTRSCCWCAATATSSATPWSPSSPTATSSGATPGRSATRSPSSRPCTWSRRSAGKASAGSCWTPSRRSWRHAGSATSRSAPCRATRARCASTSAAGTARRGRSSRGSRRGPAGKPAAAALEPVGEPAHAERRQPPAAGEPGQLLTVGRRPRRGAAAGDAGMARIPGGLSDRLADLVSDHHRRSRRADSSGASPRRRSRHR